MAAAEQRRLTPVRSARSTVKRASICVITVAALMIGIAYWVTPLAVLAWPLIMILTIAIVFGTPLLKAGPPVLMIDETEIYDTRIMKKPIPWSRICDVKEIIIRNPHTGSIKVTKFIIKTEHWEEYMNYKISKIDKYFLMITDCEGVEIDVTGLDYTTEGLRKLFRQAKNLGLY